MSAELEAMLNDVLIENKQLRAALRDLLVTHSMAGSVGLEASQRRLAAKNRAREVLEATDKGRPPLAGMQRERA